MNAWPALHTLLYDGWVLRFANGVTRRSNSVYPIYKSTINIEEKIEFCEKLYSEKSLRTSYKMTENVYPSNLDKILDEHGYDFNAETSVQTITIPQNLSSLPNYIKLREEFSEEWIKRFVTFNDYDSKKTDGYADIIQHIFLKHTFVDLIIDNNYVGCGLGVVEGKHLGIFDIVVNDDYRGKGYGRDIVVALLLWGKQNGAETAYLQVMLNNEPALNLYNKIGFREVYKYWYRVK